MTTIEDYETADWMHHRLEDAWNDLLYAGTQGRYYDVHQLDIKEGSTYTDRIRTALDLIEAHEGDLIKWQARQEAEA